MRDEEPGRDPAPDSGDGGQPSTEWPGEPAVTTLAGQCRQLAEARATGALAVTAPSGGGQVRFRDGVVISAASPAPRARLGDRLVNAGLLDQDELEGALGRQRSSPGTKLGALLVDEERVSRDAVRVFVQEQIFDAVLDLSRSQDTTLTFRDDVADPDALRIEIPVEPLLLEVQRREREWEQIERSITSLDMVPGFVPGASSMSASLEPDEFAVLASIDGQRSVRELAEDLGYSEFDAARILHGLMLLGVLRVRQPDSDDVDVGAALADALFGATPPDETDVAEPEPAVDSAAPPPEPAAPGGPPAPDPPPEPAPHEETASGDTHDEAGELERILEQVEAAEAAGGGHLRPGATPPSIEDDAGVDAETPAEQPEFDVDLTRAADLDRGDDVPGLEVGVFEADLPLTAGVEPPSDEPTADRPPSVDAPPRGEPAEDEPALVDQPPTDEPAADDEPPPADEPYAPEAGDTEGHGPAPAPRARGPERGGADVSEFLHELSRLALEDDPQTAAPPPRPQPRRAPDSAPAETGEGHREERKDEPKRKRRLFGRGG